MNKSFLSYKEATNLVIQHLNTLENIKEFCMKHELGYKNVIYLKNNPDKKKFPLLVSKILAIFGNEVSIETVYIIKY